MSNNLMDHVMMNKLDDELSEAIQSVGGDVSKAKGPWDYAEIIKSQLSAKGNSGSFPSMDIKLGPGLKIEEVNNEKYILATSEALTTCTINPPTDDDMQSIGEVINAGTPIQTVLEKLFYEILPNMPSLYGGDIIKAQSNGSDVYNGGVRTGLAPNNVYMRLFVSGRKEPVYISLSGYGLVNSESGSTPSNPSTGEPYIGSKGEWVNVDVIGNVISATLTQEGIARLNSIPGLQSTVSNLDAEVSKVSSKLDNIEQQLGDIDLSEIGTLNDRVDSLERISGASVEKLNELNEVIFMDGKPQIVTKTEVQEVVKAEMQTETVTETITDIVVETVKAELEVINEEEAEQLVDEIFNTI